MCTLARIPSFLFVPLLNNVVLGQALTPDPVWIAEGLKVNAGFDVTVASAGDVNADYFGDVVVGAA